MENILDLWNKALQKIETKLSKPSFETWMKSTKAHSLQGDTLTITAPNEFARDWLESRYLHLIADTIYVNGEDPRPIKPRVERRRLETRALRRDCSWAVNGIGCEGTGVYLRLEAMTFMESFPVAEDSRPR